MTGLMTAPLWAFEIAVHGLLEVELLVEVELVEPVVVELPEPVVVELPDPVVVELPEVVELEESVLLVWRRAS